MVRIRCSCVVELVVVAAGRSKVRVREYDPHCDFLAHRMEAHRMEAGLSVARPVAAARD